MSDSPQTRDEIIYSINLDDIQNVAMDFLDRELDNNELIKVADVVGDYIDWSSSIEMAIQQIIEPTASSEES